MAVEEQLLHNRSHSLIAFWSGGQRLFIPNREVSKLAFILWRYGNPSGTVSFNIYLFGATDIKSVITIADGTYNLRSVQTTREDAVIATGDDLELLDVSAVIRVWFN